MLHLHKNQLGKYENFLKFDDFDKGFYTFSLILEDYNGLVETPQGSLVLYKDENKSNVWEQYSILNYGTVATNYDACLFVYLDYDDSTYLDIVLDFNDYVSVELIIEKVDEDIFDLYNIDNYPTKKSDCHALMAGNMTSYIDCNGQSCNMSGFCFDCNAQRRGFSAEALRSYIESIHSFENFIFH